MVDNTIPGEVRLALYMSERYLQELEIALRLAGIPARCEHSLMSGVTVPRLIVEPADHADLDDIICTLPRECDTRQPAWYASDPRWWFMWWPRDRQAREPICPAVDMNEAARVIAVRLREQSR